MITPKNKIAWLNALLLAVLAISTSVTCFADGVGTRVLNIPARDFVYDSLRNLLYLSSEGNVHAVVPQTGVITNTLNVGADSGVIALSDDGHFLYVAVSNATRIARIDLLNGGEDALLDLGLDGSGGERFRAEKLVVMPGHARTVVVAASTWHYDRVSMFDDTTQRQEFFIDGEATQSLTFGDDTNSLYTIGWGYVEYQRVPVLRKMSITSTGISEMAVYDNVVLPFPTLKFGNGLLYGGSGKVFTTLGSLLETGLVNSAQVIGIVSDADTVFYARWVAWQQIELCAFTLSTHVRLGSVNVNGDVPLDLIHCGADRLALRLPESVLLLETTLLPSEPGTDLQATQTASGSNSVIGGSVSFSLLISNAGANTASNVIVGLRANPGATITHVTASSGVVTQTGSHATCRLNLLAAEETAFVTYSVRFDVAGEIDTFASVSTSAIDLQRANNTLRASTLVRFNQKPNSIAELTQAATSLAYDPVSGKLFASVPRAASSYGSEIIAIDPQNGGVVRRIPMPSDVSRIAVTDDGRFLYAAVAGPPAVRRIDLATDLIDIQIPLDDAPSDIDTIPGWPTACVVINYPWFPKLYDDAVLLGTPNWGQVGELAVVSSNRLVGWSFGVPSVTYTFEIISNSLTTIHEAWDLGLPGVKASGGLAFANSGSVFDPSTTTVVAQLPASAMVEPDLVIGRAFFLVNEGEWKLKAFDVTTTNIIGTLSLPQLRGSPRSMVRCGDDRLVIGTDARQLLFVRTDWACPAVSIKTMSVTPPSVAIRFFAARGSTYVLEAQDSAQSEWQGIRTVVGNGVEETLVENTTNRASRIYRLQRK